MEIESDGANKGGKGGGREKGEHGDGANKTVEGERGIRGLNFVCTNIQNRKMDKD